MQLFGYIIAIKKVEKHKRPFAKNYTVWSRKGKCPLCNVSQGSRHNKNCAIPKQLMKGKKI